MKIGIIAAMEQEMRVLSHALTEKQLIKKHHLSFLTGQLKNHQVVIVQSGIGKVNAAIATTLLVTHFSVEHIINTGSAGALKKTFSIGDVVVSNKVAHHDVNVTAFGYAVGQVPQMPLYYEASKQLMKAALNAIEKVHLRGVVGEVVSSDSFIASKEATHYIQKHFPHALCSEMEGAAIAQTCHILNIPFVVVRAISDSADENANVSFDAFIEEAGRKSAEMVLYLLEELP